MRTLILPVIVAARELDAKLLIAIHAAQAGIRTVIGSHTLINLNLHRFDPGVYLSPSFTRGSQRIVEIARQLGHGVAAFDEAALVWHTEADYRKRRTHRETLAALDAVFAWGREHARILAPATDGLPVAVKVTGHPRSDLLRPEIRAAYQDRISSLKSELGGFVLITSSFAWLNSLQAIETETTGVDRLEAIAAKSNFAIGHVRHIAMMFEDFAAMLPVVARRFPERQVVVRPHPAENAEGWRRAAQGLSNIQIRFDSDLVPWLMAAGHVIHTGGTIAIETAILGRTPISYRPHIDEEHEFPQPNAVSVNVRSQEELIEILADEGFTDRRQIHLVRTIEDMVESLEGPLAAERIARDVAAMFEDGRPGHGSRLRRLVGQVASLKRSRDKRAERDDPASTSNPALYTHKFPPIGRAEIEARAAGFAARLGLPAPRIEEFQERMVFEVTAR